MHARNQIKAKAGRVIAAEAAIIISTKGKKQAAKATATTEAKEREAMVITSAASLHRGGSVSPEIRAAVSSARFRTADAGLSTYLFVV